MHPETRITLSQSSHWSNRPLFKYHSLLMGLKIVTVLVRFLEGMFFVGTVGSAVVFVLSGIEDLKMLLGREEEDPS